MLGFKKNRTAAFALFLSSAVNTVNATASTGSIKAKPVLRAGNAKKLRDEHSITDWMGLAEPPNTPELPDDCSQLDAVNSSGMCLYNDCSRTGAECFYSPPNGCGTEGFTIPTWVYDEACCIHDYCYSSNRYSQRHCDNTFFDDMQRGCDKTFCWWGNRMCLPGHTTCLSGAWAAWGGLTAAGSSAYNGAQVANNEWMTLDNCVP